MITMTVVYCCFHRCRIPRTKQEIEADLMRSNLTNKFRDYLQELPNEPTTFVEALKKVQELEEKLEKDDASLARDLGARKRMGWLKLKGKDEKTPATDNQVATDKNDNLETKEPTTDADGGVADPISKQDSSQVVVPIEPELGLKSITKATEGAVALGLPSSGEMGELEGGRADGLADQTEVKSVAASLGRQSRKVRRHKPNLSRSKRAREKSQGEPADLEAPTPLQNGQQPYPAPLPPPPPPPPSPPPDPPEVVNPTPAKKERHHHKLHRRHKVRKELKAVASGETGVAPGR